MGITKRIVAPGLSVNGGLPENGGAQSSKEWGTRLPENCGTQSRGDWCPHSLRELRAPSLPENVGLLENKDHPVSQRIGVSEWGNPEFQSVGDPEFLRTLGSRRIQPPKDHPVSQINFNLSVSQVGFQLYKLSYTSKVDGSTTLDGNKIVTAVCENKKLFDHLNMEWKIEPGPKEHTSSMDFLVSFK